MGDSQFTLIEFLLIRLYLEGVEDIVVSPGSRNASIIEALVSYDKFTLHRIPDERSAAFFALGCTIKTGKPSVLLCTSGSAVLNYLPGVSEAFYQERPLIVISADRPESFVGQMAGQTINQQNSLKNFVKDFQQLSSDDVATFSKRKIEDAFYRMTNGNAGPIHLNIPLEEPFYGYNYKFNQKVKKVDTISSSEISENSKKRLVADWNSKKSIWILCGCLDPNTKLQAQLDRLSADERVVILKESTSNLRINRSFESVDHLMFAISNQKEYTPDLLITLGRNVVSKKVKTFLKSSEIKSHWSFDQNDFMVDTYNSLSKKIISKPEKVLADLPVLKGGDYFNKLNELDSVIRKEQVDYLHNLPFSDYKVFQLIYEAIPNNTIIHYANSSIIRYSNLFDLKTKEYTSFANRGTSGIDGSTSTAVGFASKSEKLNILITGEISFLYDINGLFNSELPKNLKIIVINNGGGGIFDIIEGAKDSEVKDQFLKYTHQFSIDMISNRRDFEFFTSNSTESFNAEIQLFITSDKLTVLEIDTSKCDNSKSLLTFMSSISEICTRV